VEFGTTGSFAPQFTNWNCKDAVLNSVSVPYAYRLENQQTQFGRSVINDHTEDPHLSATSKHAFLYSKTQ
jgi:hypothetical protein